MKLNYKGTYRSKTKLSIPGLLLFFVFSITTATSQVNSSLSMNSIGFDGDNSTANKSTFALVSPKNETPGKKPLSNLSHPSIDYSLEERSVISVPELSYNIREQGKVVVEILVDKNGNVLEADPNGKGTKTSSFVLKNEATKIALATKFSETEKFEEQKGTITIIFSSN